MQPSPTPPLAAPAPDGLRPPDPVRPADRVLIGWLWRGHVRQRLAFLLGAVVLMALEGSMLGAFSLLIEPLFDQILVGGRADLIGWVAAGIAGAFVVRALASLVHKTMIAWLSERSWPRCSSSCLPI